MKKKVLLSLLVFLFVVTGCTPVTEKGEYKEGVYFGSVEDNYGGSKSVSTAVVYVDKDGFIKSVFMDATYSKDDVLTTKKTLGEKYNMIVASPIKKEWFEQVEAFEKKIVDEQGLSWLKWSDEEQTTTDSVSGVTMKIDALYKAVNNALEQAK